MDTGQKATFESWAKFLHPPTLKENLIKASLYLTAYESLKNAVIDQVKDFFWTGFSQEEGDRYDKQYQEKVLSRNKKAFQASLLWFQEMGAIDEADLEIARTISDHRNEIAHELPNFVASNREVDLGLLLKLMVLVSKIDRWWIREIELPISGDYSADEVAAIPDSEFNSGRMIFLMHLLQIASGEVESEYMLAYEQFLEAGRAVGAFVTPEKVNAEN